MNIIVCIKRVPDLTEAEIRVDRSGKGIVEEDLAFGINEWDNFAVEEGVRIREAAGGTVTVITVGGEESEEVLRRALAMGADTALRLDDPAFSGSDPFAIATILHAAISGLPHDLVLTGAVSADGGGGQVGGMLAGMLGLPQVALATAISIEKGMALVTHEVEGGMERIVEVDLPALVTVQTGINEPRYVSIRGIRKVSGVEIPVKGAADLGLDADRTGGAGSRVAIEELFLPPAGKGAEMLEGSTEEVVTALVERLRDRGAL